MIIKEKECWKMLTEHVYNKRTLIFKLSVYANKNI